MFQFSITAIDTGSSLLVAPTDVAELINKELGAEKNWAGQVRYRQILEPCDPHRPNQSF